LKEYINSAAGIEELMGLEGTAKRIYYSRLAIYIQTTGRIQFKG
jgi:CRISPR/Cas system-associated endonuclease Cas1